MPIKAPSKRGGPGRGQGRKPGVKTGHWKPSHLRKVNISAKISKWLDERIREISADTGIPRGQIIEEALKAHHDLTPPNGGIPHTGGS